MNQRNYYRSLLLLILIVLLLGGCAPEKEKDWVPVRGAEQTDSSVFRMSDQAAATDDPQPLSDPAIEVIQTVVTDGPMVTTTAAPMIPETEYTEMSEETIDRSNPVSSLETEEETTEGDTEVKYIANTKTKKFHYPDCSSVKDMKESNKLYFTGTREELIEQGYQPCKRCDP